MSDAASPPPTDPRVGEVWARTDAAEFLRRMQDGGWRAAHVELLGYTIEEVEPGAVRMAWQVPDVLLNPAGIAHGGFLAAMLDDAAGSAAATDYPRFVPQLTVQMTTDFLRPVSAGVTHRVDGRVVRSGRTTSVADAAITGPDGGLLARASGIFQPNRRAIPEQHWGELGLA